jgi:hypothetical protein
MEMTLWSSPSDTVTIEACSCRKLLLLLDGENNSYFFLGSGPAISSVS